MSTATTTLPQISTFNKWYSVFEKAVWGIFLLLLLIGLAGCFLGAVISAVMVPVEARFTFTLATLPTMLGKIAGYGVGALCLAWLIRRTKTAFLANGIKAGRNTDVNTDVATGKNTAPAIATQIGANHGLITGVIILAVSFVFIAGFLAGRQYPKHHYQLLNRESSRLLLDSSTGRVCDVFKSKWNWDRAVEYWNAQPSERASNAPDLSVLNGHEPCPNNR